mgnify:CR=1 FL=1
MSGEQIIEKKINLASREESVKSKTLRVNINNLLSKVREERSKERKENYLFLGLICTVVVVTGIIASL